MRPEMAPIARPVALFLVVWAAAGGALLGSAQSAAAQAPATPSPPAPVAVTTAKPAPGVQTKAQPKASTPPLTASARRAAALDAGPTVMSSDAAAALRKKNARDDRYGGASDWRDVPAWRQASFFGLRAEGKVFIFVVDRSGSMDDGDRLDRAKRELVRTIRAMQAPQQFHVIFYNDRPTPMPGDLPKTANDLTTNQLARWLNQVDAYGGTDPRAALQLALAYRPDAVFLLSDGAFPEGTAPAVATLNRHKVPIHCVDLAGGAGGDDLKIIARDSGGLYSGGGR